MILGALNFSGAFKIDIFEKFHQSVLGVKIKDYAKENEIIVKYEQFKMHIKEEQKRRKEKYSFLNPFKQSKPLSEYLADCNSFT